MNDGKRKTLKIICFQDTIEISLKKPFVLSRFILSYASDLLCEAPNIDYPFFHLFGKNF